MANIRRTNLHECHPAHEDEQRQPLVHPQLPAQHGHGEQGRGQDLQLVRHLIRAEEKRRKETFSSEL